jgi:hypothetical protein
LLPCWILQKFGSVHVAGLGLKLQAAPAAVLLPMAFTFSLFIEGKGRPDAELLLDDGEQVFFAHDQQFLAIDLHGLAGVLAEQNAVADLHGQLTDLAIFQDLAVADGQDFALVRLFGRCVRQNDTGSGLGFLVEALDDNAIVQRAKIHENSLIFNKLALIAAMPATVFFQMQQTSPHEKGDCARRRC